MSLLVKTVQIFSALSAVATAPLTVTFANKHMQINSGGGIRKTSEIVQPIKQETRDLQPKDVLSEVARQIGPTGNKIPSCFWLPNQQRLGLELLMCVYMDKLSAPLLFHYDSRNQLGRGKRVKQVENIVFTETPTTMKFKNEGALALTRTSKLYLTTQFRKQITNLTLVPENHCKVEQNSKNYQLICKEITVGGVELTPLHQNSHRTIS